MNKTYHKFLIIFSIFILIGGVYIYFSNEVTSEAALSSSLGDETTNNETPSLVSSDEKINSDISFIASLSSLTRIKIDTTLFEDKSFTNLNDNTVKIEAGISGRVNPFSPIVVDFLGNSMLVSPVETNEPFDVKVNTAVLSGSVEDSTLVTSSYFEYGPTEALGQKTPSSTISLIGTFISNITGLNSKTTYFYKACAKVSGVTLCGDIVSFYTN